MGTVPGLAGGLATGQKNVGIPVLGNNGGLNQYSPPLQAGLNKTHDVPVAATPVLTGHPTAVPPNSATPLPGTKVNPISTVSPLAAGTSQPPMGTTPANGITTPTNSTSPVGNNPKQMQQIQKQLIDIYGKGEGGLLFNLLNGLGGSDSSYMQAYMQAMSKQSAQDLSTIGTSLGNAGISADSSTSAIEKSNYMSGVAAQTGLQEQQLLLQQQQESIGLVQGLQKDAKAENSTTWLNTFAQVDDVVAGIAGSFFNPGAAMGAVSGGSIPGIGSTAEGSLGNAFQPNGPITGGLTMPGMTPGVDLSALNF